MTASRENKSFGGCEKNPYRTDPTKAVRGYLNKIYKLAESTDLRGMQRIAMQLIVCVQWRCPNFDISGIRTAFWRICTVEHYFFLWINYIKGHQLRLVSVKTGEANAKLRNAKCSYAIVRIINREVLRASTYKRGLTGVLFSI